MIRLVRPTCPHPAALQNGNYKHPRNKQALKDAAFDKCMYCESRISHIDFAHVEHIKPKAEDKYPQLAFAWNNPCLSGLDPRVLYVAISSFRGTGLHTSEPRPA